ncbi:hypothetical protein C3F09_04735 [candidate division GN15 bacterium]|uniref:Uncharacterized protein n=1 Tax=candidate division GN15 bacterium TaxID=2072418 RepID=A0A855X2B2_9BACT|nr:MAG: hypothetical protein C3F09_04735 [candidate division GN15 bacterium]
MRGLRIKVLVTVIFTFLHQSIGYAAEKKKDTAVFYGSFIPSFHHDTAYIDFNVTLLNLVPDSITIELFDFKRDSNPAVPFVAGSDTVLHKSLAMFRLVEGLSISKDWVSVRHDGNRLVCKGHIRAPLDTRPYKFLQSKASAFVGTDTLPKVECYDWSAAGYGGLFGNFWLPGWGYYSSQPNNQLNKHGMLMSYDIALETGDQRQRLIIGSYLSGTWKAFTFAEPFAIRYQRYLGERQRFALGAFTGLKLTKIKHVQGDIQYRKVKWGFEGGASVETPFERLSYSYSTPAGGYHTAELFLCAESGSTGYRIGTLFTARWQDNIWMVQMAFHIEGVFEGRPLLKENRRPFVLKALAWSGTLPALITYGAYYGVCKIFGKDPTVK